MADESPLEQLRALREENWRDEARIEARRPRRDRLIREAVAEASRRKVAKAAGISHTRVQQIVDSG